MAVPSTQLSNPLSDPFDNWFDNRLDVCLHDTAGCQTSCTAGLSTGCIVYTGYDSDFDVSQNAVCTKTKTVLQVCKCMYQQRGVAITLGISARLFYVGPG